MRLCDLVLRRMKVVIVLWQVVEVLQQVIAQPERKEYCQHEYFNVTCGSGEVILMDSANYGRMRAGSCVSTNTGCSVSVREYFDRRCSGRRHCSVFVSDQALQKLAPCSKDYTSYLEASYTCLAVAVGSSRAMVGCSKDRPIPLTGRAVGYIASSPLTETGYGNCPWKIEAEPGQTVRLSLLSFGAQATPSAPGDISDPREGPDMGPNACYEIGSLVERTENAEPFVFSLCSENSRESVFFVSTGSVVTVQLKPPEVLRGLAPFIVRYEVRGCRPLRPPTGGHVKVEGNTATVRCNESRETWFLTCAGNSWLGHTGNCSDKGASSSSHGDVASLVEDNFPYGILLVVAIGVALGVLIGGILLSCVAYYMKRQTRLHGYTEPSEWTKQMLDEMEAYNEAKQLAASTRYLHEAHKTTTPSAASAAVTAGAMSPASATVIVATPNRTVTMDRVDFNPASAACHSVAHARGCTCPKEEDEYTSAAAGNDCRLVLSTAGAPDSSPGRFLYEIPQFNN